MHVENITSNAMSLNRNGQSMLIQVYEKEIDRLNNIIKELSKDVDMWNKKYNEQFNIINELEKWAKEELEHPNWASCGARCMLDKLKELKENNK